MSATDLPIEDYGNVINALTDGPSLEATVSFSMEWTGGGGHTKIRDHDTDFGGRYVQGTAAMEWSGSNEKGEVFQSDPASTSSALFAEVGHERNGSFFREPGPQTWTGPPERQYTPWSRDSRPSSTR
jgi:hypothetical protein